MDSKAQRKALFRSKLKEAAQNRDTRIDSPLVRYNESDQPVCRVCNVTLKSESLWPAHQASRKHHEAIESIKATAAGLSHGSNRNSEPPAELHKPGLSSTLPSEFFDSQAIKRQKNEHPQGKNYISHAEKPFKVPESVKKTNEQVDVPIIAAKDKSTNIPSTKLGQPPRTVTTKRALPEGFFDDKESESSKGFIDSEEKTGISESDQFGQPSRGLVGPGTKVKGELPEGFFDNKDADLRARGVEPVKVDINDAYKEFEKEIKDDLQEVDDRLEEEEIDAAEIRGEFDSLEQKGFREQVDMVKKKLADVKAARLARGKKAPAFRGEESSDESSSDEDEDAENFTVDWRAQHL